MNKGLDLLSIPDDSIIFIWITDLLYSNQQSALLSHLNTISQEHTHMQLESTHRLEQLMAEVRSCAKGQERDSRTLKEKLHMLAAEGYRVANEENILSSLKFDEWKRRFNVVPKAYSQTFDWILKDTINYEVPPTRFKLWLQSQHGIYWIAGKAGSGKSTLMKFLVNHPDVTRYLEEWAGPDRRVFLLRWFFWSAGSPMQRSQEGLFQSLLFQILRCCPWLMPVLCPERWEDNSIYGGRSDPWTGEELHDAFDTLAHQEMAGIRFCIFIDGLDEYDGLPSDLIRVLKSLVASPSIKLCVSSRPWNEFLTAFEDGKSDGTLLLEKYTRPDVERFVRDILKKNESFTLAEQKDKRYGIFVTNIINRANGVFLWVQLVVTRILKGLEERNKLEDLQKKLEAMPPTLEQFFQQIFDRIDKADWTESAQVFLLTTRAVQRLSVVAYYNLEKVENDPDHALKAAVKPVSPSQMISIYTDVRDRLNFLCKDLLEVNEVQSQENIVDYQVDFLHRTVKDFLMTKDMHQQLMQRATNNSTLRWDTYQSLCKLALIRAKGLPLHNGIRSGINALFTLVDEFMFYAHEVEVEQKVPDLRMLEELDHTITHYADADMVYHWTNARDPPTGLHFDEANCNTFLAFAVQSRLQHYVKERLENDPKLLRTKEGRPLLDYALRPNIVTPAKLPHLVEYIDFDMVRILLDKGANPNEKVSIYGGISIWGLFLLSCYERKSSSGTRTQGTWFQAAEMMIRKGANRQLKLETTRTETISSGSESQAPQLKTAKYKRSVALAREGKIQVEVPVELTAMGILQDIFGKDKINELNAIVPDTSSWNFWSLLGWR